jgi:DNA-binding PadR family transcriptional regulator
MGELNMSDLEILYLGIKKDGRFDEKDIEKSDLNKLGVGRILDQLASLKERNLIDLNKDGSFSVTNVARHILWDSQIPLWIKILRILEIKSQDIEKISSFLLSSLDQILPEIEDLRKKQLVLMSPLRNDKGIVKMYEILPDGVELVKKAQSEGIQNKPEKTKPQIEIWSIIEETIEEIQKLQEIPEERKNKIISKILQIKDKLEI